MSRRLLEASHGTSEADANYMDWYQEWAHPYVENLDPEAQRYLKKAEKESLKSKESMNEEDDWEKMVVERVNWVVKDMSRMIDLGEKLTRRLRYSLGEQAQSKQGKGGRGSRGCRGGGEKGGRDRGEKRGRVGTCARGGTSARGGCGGGKNTSTQVGRGKRGKKARVVEQVVEQEKEDDDLDTFLRTSSDEEESSE
ncbi:bromodomain and WD repeat-containing protein 3-like [Papaver somniferum]|uniref:bromodomain and WD repeat-containing protein 3-like n=1 Tax=Papaver somniferum TaxID=3469 RepID=UPI000E6FCEEE|nr:bromodomain and WD repeat-containing protein 3-like [Papaver somniferum]